MLDDPRLSPVARARIRLGEEWVCLGLRLRLAAGRVEYASAIEDGWMPAGQHRSGPCCYCVWSAGGRVLNA